MKKGYLLPLVLLSWAGSFANVRLPKIFSDNMVLQRNQPIPVWGWADAKEKITLQFNKQTKIITASKDGRWLVKLDPEPEGGPYQLVVKGKTSITVSEVLVGEVWVCSGQSNMEMPIAGWGKVKNYEQEIADADYPQIRQFLVTKAVSTTPKDDVAGGDWKPCTPATAGDFTAVGYFFARELYKQLHVPIGLINTSWGGTMVETWISRGAFEHSDEFKPMIAKMSSGDLDLIAKQKSDGLQKKIESLQGSYVDHPNTDHWKEEHFDDSHWPTMHLPGLWEGQKMGLDDLDGLVWFRKTIIVDDVDAGKRAVIELGKIDDSDETYVNGVKVGEMKNKYSEPRSYNIGAGILKAGKNTIAIRVEDTGGGGGVYGNGSEMKLTIGEKTRPLDGDWLFRVESIYKSAGGTGPNSFPTLLFNAMLNPLIPYGIKGAIWYQGETNAGRAMQYRKAFPLMITDWRQQWSEGNFPFYFVQLASFNAGNGDSEHGSSWAELREAQTMTLGLPNTGMAVTTDIGEALDIHPKNKQDVGKRLAAAALSNAYAHVQEYSGPLYQSMQTDGNKIILSFTHTGSGLMAKDKYGYIKGFEVAGSDQKFHYARANIDGDKVIVNGEGVAMPVAVRYAWADNALEANLYNKEGFPASSFRTDSWKGITDEVKYVVGQ
ncbi:MAG TPA: sialate O-acetylesterase [Puia sp.]|jgi:sialate O-acetylesterase|nr:sialate O-acetylesterase [Puia sp.]